MKSNYPRPELASPDPAGEKKKRMRLGLLGVLAMVVGTVLGCGAGLSLLADHPETRPDGSEVIVSAGGPMSVLLLFIAMGLLLGGFLAVCIAITRAITARFNRQPQR